MKKKVVPAELTPSEREEMIRLERGIVHFLGISADQSLIRWPFHPIRWI